MKRFSLFIIAALATIGSLCAQVTTGDFAFKFYGRVRADLFYNSRTNEETVDGLFYMYPKDHNYDAAGEDLNATPQSNMYVIYTRLGVDITGPKIGSAKTSAKIEMDFRGSGSTYAFARIRHAYVNLDWAHASVLVGQTWHPLFGEVSPSVLNLSTGAPFQPFNRSPQARFRYHWDNGIQLTAAAIWQSQYNSAGPVGKSHTYLKNSCIPELYVGADYKDGGFLAGVGAQMISLKPRTQAEVDGLIYKVNERVTSLSAEAHIKYKTRDWNFSGKTVYASNLTHCSMPGGYAVTAVNPVNGEQHYSPFHHSMTWVNVTYGKRWQPGLFVGYLKNLGVGKEITGTTYGTNTDLDQVLNISAQLSYNIKALKIGLEVTPCWAWYGSIDPHDGKVVDPHSVFNFRALAVAMYSF
ncbi:MAG: hypothetical protein LIP02_05970 [Bacteroidales bacterium]|nr:hypothetical protein [Bacteroidales bacterium]